MKDALSTRMKENYESRTRFFLPRRSYTLIRVDGKAFHTYTKGLQRPFDMGLIDDMDATAVYLCKNIMGAQFAFVQSDEISIVITDFKDISTQAWFDNNLQKMCSISASLATAKFNQLRMVRQFILEDIDARTKAHVGYLEDMNLTLAMFDSRVWQIPDSTEVENYFIWRQQDTVRNSIFSVAQSLYSHKELHKKNGNEMQEMIFQKGINWNDYSPNLKRGRIIVKESYTVLGMGVDGSVSTRSKWVVQGAPDFTKEREWFNEFLPKQR